MLLQRTNTGKTPDLRPCRGAPLACRAAGLLVVLLATACTKGPGTGGNQQKTGWLDNNVGVSRILTPGSTSASEVFQLADGALSCILTILPIKNDNSTFYQPEPGQQMGTVSGEMNCNNQGGATFTDIAVPGKQRFPFLGVVLDFNSITRRFGESGPSVDVTLYADCESTGCPGGVAKVSGSGQPSEFSGLRSGLGAQWIVSPPAGPGAASFQVALPGQETRECWVYVTAVDDHRQSNSGDDYVTEAPVSGEVWCAPYAPVVFTISVPSNRYAEVRPRALNPDGPPVLLTFWSTRSLPPQANVGIAADCPTGTCPPPPAVGTTPGPVTTPVPVVGGSRSRDSLSSGTDTVFDAEKHWYLCQDGIDSAGQRFYCPRQGYDCVREPREYTAGTFIQCRETTNACEWADGNTFRECLLNDGRIGWAYCNIDGHWNGCQAPGNKRGECSWVFGQLASIWGPDLGELPGRARTALLGQKSGCTAGDPAATPTPKGSSSSPTSSYAASGTAGNTAPPANQSLCGKACPAGSSCVFAVDFNPIGRSANKDSAVIVQPTCMSLNDFKGRTAKLPEVQATAAIGYRQCRPDGATGWCGVGAVFTNGGKSPPLNPTACTRVPSTPLGFGFRLVGLRVPPCSGVQQ